MPNLEETKTSKDIITALSQLPPFEPTYIMVPIPLIGSRRFILSAQTLQRILQSYHIDLPLLRQEFDSRHADRRQAITDDPDDLIDLTAPDCEIKIVPFSGDFFTMLTEANTLGAQGWKLIAVNFDERYFTLKK